MPDSVGVAVPDSVPVTLPAGGTVGFWHWHDLAFFNLWLLTTARVNAATAMPISSRIQSDTWSVNNFFIVCVLIVRFVFDSDHKTTTAKIAVAP